MLQYIRTTADLKGNEEWHDRVMNMHKYLSTLEDKDGIYLFVGSPSVAGFLHWLRTHNAELLTWSNGESYIGVFREQPKDKYPS